MTEHPGKNQTPLRPHISGLAAGALITGALNDSYSDTPWPDGYERISLLGVGGMGEVHLARDSELGREVAIKLVHHDLQNEPMILDRLQREARIMSSFNHPGIVTIHRLIPLGDNSAAIVMEYVDGGNLRDLVQQHGSSFPINEALRIARETAFAIHAAHQHGIVHRDLKPENILIASDGRVKVTDFGLAAPLDPLATRLTMAGTATGTADYMAPERHSGHESGPLGDVYSLGVMLYEILTGTLPRGHFDPPRAVRSDIPKAVSDAVMRAMKNDPSQRFVSVEAFAASLAIHTPSRSVILPITAGTALVIIAAISIQHLSKSKPTETTAPINIPKPPPALSSAAWRKLMPADNSTLQSISGSWQKNSQGLVSNNQICILKLADDMPDAYDVRMTFTRLEGAHSIALFFATANGVGSIDIDGWDKGLSGVQSINGQDLRQSNAFTVTLENQRTYQLDAQIRPDAISISIDGVHKITTPIKGSTLGVVSPWQWNPNDKPAALAIGSYQSATRFSSIEWRPLAD